jgi:hypothetical protein
MTPQFLLDTPVHDRVERSGHAAPAERQWATATAEMRITRGAAPENALVAVVGLSETGLPNALGGVNRWAQRILWDDPGTDTGGCGCVGT